MRPSARLAAKSDLFIKKLLQGKIAQLLAGEASGLDSCLGEAHAARMDIDTKSMYISKLSQLRA